ncbi:Myb-like_DNA-binding domain-containing protein [Hexamita inflata]|uniref:Myb-like_DNA-binding domain-containing protein n=1 Tax=Hexamita inflata TaxID=28002 RepID=A0ABP1ISV8_9EUKA
MKSNINENMQAMLLQQEKLISRLCYVENQLLSQQQQQAWTENEHQRFIEYINIFGKNKQKEVAHHIQTKNAKQVASHSQKFFNKLSQWFLKQQCDMQTAQNYFLKCGLSHKVAIQFLAELTSKSQ